MDQRNSFDDQRQKTIGVEMDFKDKKTQKIIGMVLAALLTIGAAVAGFSVDALKEGFCGEPQASEVKASAVNCD